jgi:hypothetical protein
MMCGKLEEQKTKNTIEEKKHSNIKILFPILVYTCKRTHYKKHDVWKTRRTEDQKHN